MSEDGIEAYAGVAPGSVVDGREAFGLRTRYVGTNVHCFAAVTSTSSVLRELAQEGAAAGTVVLADEQTAGRGRSGRVWFSPAGLGVWASVLLKPSVSADELAPLSIAAAVSVAGALAKSTGAPLGVKWPNDIVAEGWKLGGILVESVQTAGEKVESAVLGIGVNVGATVDDLPPELADSATSLETLLGRPVPRVDVLRATLEALEECFDLFGREGIGGFRERWRMLSSTLGQRVNVRTGETDVEGTVTDISPAGALVIETRDGVSEEVWYGDVTLRRS